MSQTYGFLKYKYRKYSYKGITYVMKVWKSVCMYVCECFNKEKVLTVINTEEILDRNSV